MFKINTKYNSQKYPVGKIFPTNHNGDFEILGKAVPNIAGCYVIRFLDTEYTTIADTKSISVGAVKDYLKRSVYDVGYYGVGSHKAQWKGEMTRPYQLWLGMMARCYSHKYLANRPSYRNTTVHLDWHNYQTFADDITQLDGYHNWLNKRGEYQLDKDVLQPNCEHKVYSKHTCVFITSGENTIESAERVRCKPFLATRMSDGYQEEGLNQADFCRKHDIKSCHIHSVLNGSRKSCGGWVFKEL